MQPWIPFVILAAGLLIPRNCEGGRPDPVAAATAYKQVFYDNDFSYLREPGYGDRHLGERMKRLRAGDSWWFDFGGEYRSRFHHENNLRTKPLSGRNDDFLLHRTRLYANAEYGGLFRFYGEAIDAASDAHRRRPRATELNRFDAINLFGDVRLWSGGSGGEAWLRGGRQEMVYGSQRLLSNRPWRNTTVTFDGIKAFWKNEASRLDAFWLRPIDIAQHLPRDHNFDRPDQSQQFFGFFGTHRPNDERIIDGYYLGLTEDDAKVVGSSGIAGGFETHTLGGRLLDKSQLLHYEVEGGYQFGRFASDDHSAGFVTLGLGHRWAHDWQPALWLFYDWASGDGDLTDEVHGTFNHQFPRGHYYLGFADVAGRQNLHDINLRLAMAPHARLKLLVWWHLFYLSERRDALYSPGGVPIYHDPTGSSGNEVGQELDLATQWLISPRANIAIGYAHFFAGDYFDSPVIRGGPAGLASNGADGNDADFVYTQFILRF